MGCVHHNCYEYRRIAEVNHNSLNIEHEPILLTEAQTAQSGGAQL